MTDPKFWHQAPKDACHSEVFEHIAALDREQGDIHTENVAYAQLYSNRMEPGLGGSRSKVRAGDDGSVTENVIQSVIDTATSLIGKSRPKVTVLTDGGDWELQRLAKQVEKYIWGLFQSLDVYEKMTLAFRDACVWGTGVLKVFVRRGQICVERVLVDELVVDEQEVPAGGTPRQVHRVRRMSKAVLKSLYDKKHHKAIDDSTARRRSEYSGSQVDADMVLVVESHLLPAGPDSPGRYTVCVEGATLEDKPWTDDWFPYVWFTWSPPLTGFYGQGLAESLLGTQVRINELNDFINRCQDLIAVPRVAIDAGSRLMKIQLDNEIGAIIPYVGKPPIFMNPTAVSAEVYRYKEQLKASAFEFAGISKMAAQATRPEGIEAAVALRELSDNQNQRFSWQQQRLEASYMAVGRLLIEMAKKLGKSAPKMFFSDVYAEEIEWPSIDFDKLKFVLHVAPSSMMSMTPAGRLQKVIELAQYGVPLSPDVMTRLLGHPDLGLEDDRRTSPLEDAEWVCSRLARGEYMPPEPFQNLKLCIERVNAAYLTARRSGAKPRILDLHRRWIKQATEKVNAKAQKDQAAMAAAMPGVMPGMPAPQMPAAAMSASALPGVAATM